MATTLTVKNPGPTARVPLQPITPRAQATAGALPSCAARRSTLSLLLVAVLVLPASLDAQSLSVISGVEAQPLKAQARRIVEALGYVGSPISPGDQTRLKEIFDAPDDEKSSQEVQKILNAYVVNAVHINPESRVKVAAGPAKPELLMQGWRTFLVRVHNEAGVTAELQVESPNAAPLYKRSTGSKEPEITIKPGDVGNRWMDIALYTGQPLQPRLSGLLLEYRIVEIYARDSGKREAKIMYNVGQGTQDIGFRNEVDILFDCVPSVEVILDVRDHDGSETMASFEVRDRRGRLYPAPSRRLAPDFFFHPQVYRATGESIHLPAGEYEVIFTRGPEYLVSTRTIEVPPNVKSHREKFDLERWVHPLKLGWFSGDHHVHGGGCAHYESPTAGVTPKDMFRHQLGEDLNIACVLTWGPCWYFQKQFFEGRVNEHSTANYKMRYDVEVSGFPSDHSGHLSLLRLKEDDYPGTTRTEQWPSWDLPILTWAKEQGGVVGFSHSGWGLAVETDELPNYVIPPFDGIGANEFIVDVVHGVVDFISSVDTPYVWELNIWYHTLNCGFRTRISGETDFPCIYGDKVGLGRIYCKLDGELNFDKFCDAIREGRSYVGDGLSHLIDFSINGVEIGTRGSEVHVAKPGRVKVTARVAAYLDQTANPDLSEVPYSTKPYWHIERARIKGERKVPLEIVVNGQAVARHEIVADGKLRDMTFDVPIERSSWVALRILPSSHTNPIFVLVDGKPVRASRRSADWCLKSVDQCWERKHPRIRESERDAARKAYDVARTAYRKILAESHAD